jgi:adenylylsulfate kinase-like enzyme
MTGIGSPYEAPCNPDLVLHSGEQPVEVAVEQVMDLLSTRLPHPSPFDGLRTD